MAHLGLEIAAAEIDKLFDEWDPDGSGELDLKELTKVLRRGGEVALDGKLQAGAAGEIKLKAETKYAVRKGGPAQRGTSLRKIDLDEDSGVPYSQQLQALLVEQAVRVIDLFREWDEDGNGIVSKDEFRKAMPLLGLEVPVSAIDELFDSWDPDGSGELDMKELNRVLRRRVEGATSRMFAENKLASSEKFAQMLATADRSDFVSTVASLHGTAPVAPRPALYAEPRGPAQGILRPRAAPGLGLSREEVFRIAQSEGLTLEVKNCDSGWKGVARKSNGSGKCWRAQAVVSDATGAQRTVQLGSFYSDVEAALCYARHTQGPQKKLASSLKQLPVPACDPASVRLLRIFDATEADQPPAPQKKVSFPG